MPLQLIKLVNFIVLRITLYMTSSGVGVDSLTTFRTLLFKYVIILSLLTQDRQDRISALDIHSLVMDLFIRKPGQHGF